MPKIKIFKKKKVAKQKKKAKKLKFPKIKMPKIKKPKIGFARLKKSIRRLFKKKRAKKK